MIPSLRMMMQGKGVCLVQRKVNPAIPKSTQLLPHLIALKHPKPIVPVDHKWQSSLARLHRPWIRRHSTYAMKNVLIAPSKTPRCLCSQQISMMHRPELKFSVLNSMTPVTDCTKSNVSVTILIWSLTSSGTCLRCLESNGRLFIHHTPARIINISLTLFMFMERFTMMNTFWKGANIQPGLQMDQVPLTGMMITRKTSTHQLSTTIRPIARQLPLSNLSTKSMWLPNTNTCLNPLHRPHLLSPLFIHLLPLVKRKSLKV